MGFNKKVLSKAVSELGKAKAPGKPKDIITDPAGQWKYPGQKTRIPGNDITMQDVPYPVWAQPNVGPGSMMQPNQDYNFPGASYVDETPMAKKGGEADYEDLDLTDEEIQAYKDAGYEIEELPEAQAGTEINSKPYYNFSNDEATSYNPVTQTVNINEETLTPPEDFNGDLKRFIDDEYRAQDAHENFHHYQNQIGTNRIETGRPDAKPTLPSNQNFEGEHYHNRRQIEEKQKADEWRKAHPNESPFINPDILYNKYTDEAMYQDPSTLEGEARAYEEKVRRGDRNFNIVNPGLSNPWKKQVGGPQNTAGPRAEEIPADVNAMNAMMKARMATDAEFGNPAARRMTSPNPKTYDFGNGDLGTHFMASMGNQAVPLLQDKGGDELEYNENPPPSKEDMNFRTPEEAQYFAEHYKEVAPMMRGFKQGGFVQHELVKAQTGLATTSDSLSLYNNAIKLKGFYDNLKPYYNNLEIDPWYDRDLTNIQKETLVHPSVSSSNKTIIKNNKNANAIYMSDMITGAIDPKAPLLKYDTRIKPQGQITYRPKRYTFVENVSPDIAKIQKMTTSNAPSYSNSWTTNIVQYGLENDPIKKANYKKKLINIGVALKLKDPEKSINEWIYRMKKDEEVDEKLPGYITTLPYYDPLAIKPANMLSDNEIKIRFKKYGASGIPQSKLKALGLSSSIQSVELIDKKPVKPVQPVKFVPKPKKPVINNIYQEPIEEVTPLKRMSFPQVKRPEQQIIPAAPYVKPVHYAGPRYGTLAGDENLNLPEGYTQEQREAARRKFDADEFTRKTLEYQQKQRGAQPIVTRKQGGELDKAQKGKTVKPYYTSDRKDYYYHVKQHADSMKLYHQGIHDRDNYVNYLNKNGFDAKNHLERWNTKGWVDTDVHPTIGATYNGILENSGGGFTRDNKGVAHDYTTYPLKNGSSKNVYDESPEGKLLGKRYSVYKKPVQEVIFRANNNTIKKTLTSVPTKVKQANKKNTITNVNAVPEDKVIPQDEITPLKRMSFPQVARPKQELIPAAPYVKPVHYAGPRHGRWSDGSKGQFPEGLNTSDWERKTKEYQQQQGGTQPVVIRRQGGELDKAQGGKTTYSGPKFGLVGPSTPKNTGSPLLPKQDLIKKYQQEVDKAKAIKIAEAERVRQKAIAKQKAINDAIPRGPVSDNTRTVIPNQAISYINNAAFYNSPQETANREARKKEQAAFEKEQWNKYNKMSFAEKALDRTQAAIAHPFLMAGNALAGNQGYIPGMGRGLMNTESPEYDKYLKATGQTKGQFEVSDLANIVNPGHWGGHAGNELHKGNYGTGLLEAGLAFAGVPGSSRTAVQGVKSLAQDVTQGTKYLGSKIDKTIYPTRTYRAHLPGGNETSYEVSELAKKINKKGDWTTKDLVEAQHYLKGTEAFGGKRGLLTGDDMLLTEYKVPFWKRNVSYDKDVTALKKLQDQAVNSNEFIIPNNKFLYPRRTNLIKAVPEEVKTFEELLPNGNMANLYKPTSFPLGPNSYAHASKPYKYIEDQINAVTGHNMPLSYKFDGIIGNGKVNAPLVDWKQPRFAPNAGIGKFNDKTLPNSANVDFSKYLTQEEAVAARAERLISQKNKPGWNEQLTPDLEQRLANAVENHNPASEYAGEKLGSNTGGRSATEVSRHPMNADKLNPNSRTYDPEAVPIYLSDANKARVAAHETGHYYANSFDEGQEWLSHFSFNELPYKTRVYLRGKRFSNADEIRERAAQLKDYIAQKNGIPLNQNFEITQAQLDDAIANYVKDTGLDNAMSKMLGALKDKKGFLGAMNKYALGTIPAVIGAQTLSEEETPLKPAILNPGFKYGGALESYQKKGQVQSSYYNNLVNKHGAGKVLSNYKTINKPELTRAQIDAANKKVAIAKKQQADAQAKAEAERIAAWYANEKKKRYDEAGLHDKYIENATVSDNTRVNPTALAPIAQQAKRENVEIKRKEDQVFDTQKKVLEKGFKNVYDYQKDPMGAQWDLAQEQEAAWRKSGAERPMISTGEMGTNRGPKNMVLGYDPKTKKYNTDTGVYDPATRTWAPNPTYYQGSGAIQSVDEVWAAPIALPVVLEGIGAISAMSLPFMSTIPGATVGNLVNAGFIANSMYKTPQNAKDWYDVAQGNKNWKDVAGETGEIALGYLGVPGVTEKIIKGANAAKNFVNTTGEALAENLTNKAYNLANAKGINNAKSIENFQFTKPVAKADQPFGFSSDLTPFVGAENTNLALNAASKIEKPSWILVEPTTNSLQIKSTMKGSPLEKQLSKTGEINVNNIKTHIAKADVGQQDKFILDKVLNEKFAGKTKIDYNEFRKAVSEELVPLEKNTTGQYTNYGVDRLKLSDLEDSKNIDDQIKEIEDAYTKIYTTPITQDYDMNYTVAVPETILGPSVSKTFPTREEAVNWLWENNGEEQGILRKLSDIRNKSVENLHKEKLKLGILDNKTILYENKNKFGEGSVEHFGEKGTLGHARILVTKQEPDIMHVLEEQSDFYQKHGVLSSDKVINRMNKNSNNKALKSIHLYENAKKQSDGSYLVDFGDGNTTTFANKIEIDNAINNLNKGIEKRPAINIEQKEFLGKNIQERLLQENVKHAAEAGKFKMRYPTPETTAKIQGYPVQNKRIKLNQEKENLKYILNYEPFKNLKDTDIVNMNEYGTRIHSPNPLTKKQYLESINNKISELEKLSDFELNLKTYSPKHQTILKKYEDAPKMIKKVLGVEVKTITDAKGNTWYEFDIPETAKKGAFETKAFKDNTVLLPGSKIPKSKRPSKSKVKNWLGDSDKESMAALASFVGEDELAADIMANKFNKEIPSVDTKKVLEDIKQLHKEFWGTEEGRRRIQKLLTEMKSPVTVDEYIAHMEDVNLINNTDVREVRKGLIEVQEKYREKMFILHQQKKAVKDELFKITSGQSNANVGEVLQRHNNIQNDIIDLERKEDDIAEQIINVPDTPKSNAFYQRHSHQIQLGENYSFPSNAEDAGVHEFGHAKSVHEDLSRLPGTENKMNKRLIDRIDLYEETPEHLFIDTKDYYKTINAETYNPQNIEHSFRPDNYFNKSKGYFLNAQRKGTFNDEPVAFLNEIRADLLRNGYIKKMGDPITEEIISNAAKRYRNIKGHKLSIRLYDIANLTKKTLKTLKDELNNLNSLAIPITVGLGVAGAGALKQEKNGGAIESWEDDLDDDEIKALEKAGYIIERIK